MNQLDKRLAVEVDGSVGRHLWAGPRKSAIAERGVAVKGMSASLATVIQLQLTFQKLRE